MKKIILLMIPLLLVACDDRAARLQNLTPQAMALEIVQDMSRKQSQSESPIGMLVDDVKTDLRTFNTYGAAEVSAAIDLNIKNLNEISNMVKKAGGMNDEIFDHVVDTITEISQSYSHLDENSARIRAELSDSIKRIEAMDIALDLKIRDIQSDISKTKKQMDEVEESRRGSYETRIKMKEQNLATWQKFKKSIRGGELKVKLEKAKTGIDKFLVILHDNAMVYQDAAVTLQDVRAFRDAHKVLDGIADLGNLGDSMINSWGELGDIVEDAVIYIDDIDLSDFNVGTNS